MLGLDLINIFRLPYVIGSSKVITIKYEVENIGETAYLPKLQIKCDSSTFARVPSSCHLENEQMLCYLNQKNPIQQSQKVSLTLY